MNIKNIIMAIVVIILLYIVIRYVTTDINTLSGLQSATTMQTIQSSSLANGVSSSNFTYSIWFYINDWNYRYGEPKVVYGRMGAPSAGSASGSVPGIAGSDPCPVVVLGAVQNNLAISLTCYSTDSSTTIHTCAVSNIPIQKWVNLLISVYGRTLDVYIDGKLVKTCLLPGTANVNPDSNVYITPPGAATSSGTTGGFSGWTSKFQYFANATDPQTAWNIYQQGYGQSFLSNIFGKYKIQVSVLEGTTQNTVLTI